MKTVQFSAKNLDELPEIAQKILNALGDCRVVLIEGDLGAGKTTFVKTILSLLGSKDLGSSPTFSLINVYENERGAPIYHMDLYRLNSPEEALDIGVEEILESKHWCFIEWPEHVLPFLEYHAVLEITVENEVRKYALTTPG